MTSTPNPWLLLGAGLSAIAAQLLPFEPTNIYLAIALPLGLVGLLASRMVWRRVIDHRRRRGRRCPRFKGWKQHDR